MKGYVYIITNKSMPGIYKIGYSLKDPALRANELNSTGVPHPYVVEYEVLTDEPLSVEQKVHFALREFREGKEWFRCSFAKCVTAIKQCCSQRIYHEFSLDKMREEEKRRDARIEAEKKNKEEIERRNKLDLERKNELERKRCAEKGEMRRQFVNAKESNLKEKLFPIAYLVTIIACLSSKNVLSVLIFCIICFFLLYKMMISIKENSWKNEFDDIQDSESKSIRQMQTRIYPPPIIQNNANSKQAIKQNSIDTPSTKENLERMSAPTESYVWISCPKCNRSCRVNQSKIKMSKCPACKTRL